MRQYNNLKYNTAIRNRKHAVVKVSTQVTHVIIHHLPTSSIDYPHILKTPGVN